MPPAEKTRDVRSRLRYRMALGAIVVLFAASAIVAVWLFAGPNSSDEKPTAIAHTPTPADSRDLVWRLPRDQLLDDPRVFEPPFDFGSCEAPTLEIIDSPDPGRVWKDGEILSASVNFKAPGCKVMTLNFGGEHVPGSPWFDYYCGKCRAKSFGSNIPAEAVTLDSASGTIRFVAVPGTFPPLDLASRPNLEGFVVCSLVIGANDGNPNSQSQREQINLPCESRR